MKKLLFILMIIPMIGFGQTKIRNTQLTSGNQPSGKILKSDGATNVVWGDDNGGTNHDSLTIATGSTPYFDVNYPQIFSGQKLIDSLGVINTKIAGKEPILTKGNLTSGSSKVTIGGTGTNALIGTGASVDIIEANIVHQNISGHGTNTHAQIDTHITNDGDLSSTNEIQDLSLSGNTLSLSGDASSVDLSGYAPASGSANYVQVSPASPQLGNIWMDGNIKIKSDFNISDGFLDLAGFNFSGADTDPWVRYYRPTGVTSNQTYIWQQIINGEGNSFDFGYTVKDRGSEILSDFKIKGSIDRLGKMAINSLGKLPRSDINYVFEGDSRVAAYGNDWPLYLQSKSNFANTGYFYNVATGGNNIANIISQYATEVYPHRPTGSITKSYLFVLIGINDLSSGTPDASALWTSLLGYINQAQLDGFSVVAFTTFYRQTLTDAQEKARQQLNDYIRYNSINQSYILIDLESLFPPTSSSIYYGDDVHLNPNSNKLIAEYVNYCFSLAHDGVTLINRTSNQNVFTPPPGENFKINGAINTISYKLSGVDLFGSLTTGSRTKWDGTKLIDDTDTFAPASGSANYIRNQFEVPQNASQYISGSAIIGEKTTVANQKALFFGNSVTEMGRFSKKICQSLDLIEDNRGIGGTTMHNFYLRYSEIPEYTNEWKYVFIDYGINDTYQGYSVSDFSINLGSAIDQFIAKGWPLNAIIAITPNYISDTSYNLEDYADAVIQVSKNKGIKYTNTYWYMKDNGGADLLSDAVHPSEVGGGVMAESILMSVYGGLSASNSTVIGKSIHVGKNIYSGTYTGVPLNFINNGNTQIFPKNFISHRILSGTGTASGIDLTNNEESEGDISPAISFSSLSHGGLYNSNYAYIHGVYQGYDTSNPSFATGDIVFGTSDFTFAKERMRLSKLGHLGLGYSTGSEITNYMFSCNGSGYFNGNVGIQVSPWLKLTLPATSTNYALGFDYTVGEVDSRRWAIGNDAYEYGSFSISTESTQGSNFSDLVRFYINKSGIIKIPSISGTGTRITTASAIGELATLTNASGYLYNDGTGEMIWIKTVPQSLSGTTPTLNASNGVNANLSISGATTLTLSNLISGTSGTIYLTNNASVYRIKIAGYTIAPASNITYDSTGILLPASSVYTHSSIGWYYNGTTVQIHKADYNSITY